MGVNPIIIILSLVAFSSVFGFPGALLALPLAALIQLIVDRIVLVSDEAKERLEDNEISIQSLVDENQKLLKVIYAGSGNGKSPLNEVPESVRVEINSIANELDGLLQQIKNEEEVT